MRKVYLHHGSSHFIHHQQRNVGILSIQKDVAPEAKSSRSAKSVKVVMVEKVRKSKLGIETSSFDT